jgi:hypothetical protein
VAVVELVPVTTQMRLNDSFAQGQQRLSALLVSQSGPPQGYVPQHHLAHVRWPKQRFRYGYPIRNEAEKEV